jgi:hypothetical protein
MDHDVCIRTDELMNAVARLSTGDLAKYIVSECKPIPKNQRCFRIKISINVFLLS